MFLLQLTVRFKLLHLFVDVSGLIDAFAFDVGRVQIGLTDSEDVVLGRLIRRQY